MDQPFGGLLKGCHTGAHGMTVYDGVGPAITRIPRAAVRPRRDRFFEDTWTGQDTHTFTATGTVTIEIRRITSRAARRLGLRLRSTPRTPRA